MSRTSIVTGARVVAVVRPAVRREAVPRGPRARPVVRRDELRPADDAALLVGGDPSRAGLRECGQCFGRAVVQAIDQLDDLRDIELVRQRYRLPRADGRAGRRPRRCPAPGGRGCRARRARATPAHPPGTGAAPRRAGRARPGSRSATGAGPAPTSRDASTARRCRSGRRRPPTARGPRSRRTRSRRRAARDTSRARWPARCRCCRRWQPQGPARGRRSGRRGRR